MTRVVVTGASGFVGSALCSVLSDAGYNVVGAVRSADSKCPSSATRVVVGNIDHKTSWEGVVREGDIVIHLASRVHVMKEHAHDPLAEFRSINVAGTERLLRHCVESDAKRFIFLSSIKVNGEKTEGTPFRFDDIPHPQDAYAVSKSEAETLLKQVADSSTLEVVIIRPPLIYGPGVKGNFLRLLNVINKGVFLPLKSISNRRSMVSLGNLCDLIRVSTDHPSAPGQTFLAADGYDMSTPELITNISGIMGREARLINVPVAVLRFVGRITGKSSIIERLCSSLQVDTENSRQILNWNPPYSVEEGLQETVTWYLSAGRV